MTDEQWLWLFVNQLIDVDEQLEKMCDKCKEEVVSTDKCHRCGKVVSNDEFINPNFDKSRFESLSKPNDNNDNNDNDDDIITRIED